MGCDGLPESITSKKNCVLVVQNHITYLLMESTSNSEVAFLSTVLKWKKALVVLGRAAKKYSMKPPQPDR